MLKLHQKKNAGGMKVKNRRFVLTVLSCIAVFCTLFALASFDVMDISNSKNEKNSLLTASFIANASDTVSGISPLNTNDSRTSVFKETKKDFLSSKTQIKTYEFTVSKRGVISYSLSHPATFDLSGWNVHLYAEYFVNGVDGEKAYRHINTLQTDSSKELDTSVNIGVMPGKYRIVVSAGEKYNAATYELSCSFEARTDYEIECNDTLSRYTEIYSDLPVYGTSSYFTDTTDVDCYMFRVDYPSYVNISFEHPKKDLVSVCWKLILTDVDGNEIFAKSSLFSQEKIESGSIGLKPGAYFVSVVTYVYYDAQYTLTLSKTANETFETEINDTKALADNITFSSPVSGSCSDRSTSVDNDWYTFTLSADGYVNLNLSHAVTDDENTYNIWRISLYNEKMNLLYSKNIPFNVKSVKSPYLGLAKGKYYVLIDNKDMRSSTEVYTLEAGFVKSAKWETEPNNSVSSANVLKADSALNATMVEIGTDYDTDYFKITLDKKQNISLSLSHSVKTGNKEVFVFTLYDKNLKPIAPCDKNGKYYYNVFNEIIYKVSNTLETAETTVYYNSLPAGTYYVKVTSGIYYSNIKYSLIYKNR